MQEEITDREIGAVLDELIDVTRETKQIEWIAGKGPQREVLEALDGFLLAQMDAIARLEERIGARLTRIVSPSARPRAPLASASASDTVQARLVPHLLAVALDVRDHARRLGGPEGDFLARLADGLEEYGNQLAATRAEAPNSATEHG